MKQERQMSTVTEIRQKKWECPPILCIFKSLYNKDKLTSYAEHCPSLKFTKKKIDLTNIKYLN